MTALEVRRVAQAFPEGFSPRDHRLFGGIVQTSGTPLWGRVFWWVFGGRPGDHRDWPAIAAWAGSIADSLTRRRTAAG
jgi:menaquinone-dependent protoporphyrinogen oxidase